jgi:hypothetical protein
MEKVLNKEIDMDEVKHVLIEQFQNVFNQQQSPMN